MLEGQFFSIIELPAKASCQRPCGNTCVKSTIAEGGRARDKDFRF